MGSRRHAPNGFPETVNPLLFKGPRKSHLAPRTCLRLARTGARVLPCHHRGPTATDGCASTRRGRGGLSGLCSRHEGYFRHVPLISSNDVLKGPLPGSFKATS